MKVQVVENETLLDKADYDTCEVWLLNRTTEDDLDERVVNIPEVTEGFYTTAQKFPLLLTEISKKYFTDGIMPSDFEYEIITKDKNNYAVTMFICDEQKIKEIK